jgi:hypothetical protein
MNPVYATSGGRAGIQVSHPGTPEASPGDGRRRSHQPTVFLQEGVAGFEESWSLPRSGELNRGLDGWGEDRHFKGPSGL